MDNSPTTKIINIEINVDRAETKGRTEIFFGEGRNYFFSFVTIAAGAADECQF